MKQGTHFWLSIYISKEAKDMILVTIQVIIKYNEIRAN